MQYILSQEEFDSLIDVEKFREKVAALEVARKIITRLSEQPCENEFGGEWYCGFCPISDLGGHAKEERPNQQESHHICRKERCYSK